MSQPPDPRVDPAPEGTTHPLWWCNFCGYRTDDRKAYLAHSCAEILEGKGESAGPGTERNCR